MAAIATVDGWTALASEVDVPRHAFVDGAYVDALSGRTFECRSPIDGRVLADVAACGAADVDRAVAGARTAFASGRWATAAPKERKRVLLRLADLIREHADELALLETLDMGKPIRESRETDVRLVAECVQSRVRAETGGCYIEPTVLDGVRNDMTIAREEIFGPVLATIEVGSEAEAIALANDTMYGLAAAVWTESVDTAHRVARAIRAGVVWVNTFDAGDITSPFGGFKQSGFGRDKSIHAMEKYPDLKTVWIGLCS